MQRTGELPGQPTIVLITFAGRARIIPAIPGPGGRNYRHDRLCRRRNGRAEAEQQRDERRHVRKRVSFETPNPRSRSRKFFLQLRFTARPLGLDDSKVRPIAEPSVEHDHVTPPRASSLRRSGPVPVGNQVQLVGLEFHRSALSRSRKACRLATGTWPRCSTCSLAHG